MYQTDWKLFRSVRTATLGLADTLSEQQAAFVPAPGKWSIGEVLDHLLLAEKLYRDRFAKLIELKKAGQKAELQSDFSEIDTSVLFIPKPLLPFLETSDDNALVYGASRSCRLCRISGFQATPFLGMWNGLVS